MNVSVVTADTSPFSVCWITHLDSNIANMGTDTLGNKISEKALKISPKNSIYVKIVSDNTKII